MNARPPDAPPGRPTATGMDARWQQALLDLLARSHLLTGDGIPATLDDVLAPLTPAPELFIVDHDQVELRPLRSGAAAGPIRVDGTLPGRTYQLGTMLEGHDDEGHPVLWVPLVDGTERLGLFRFRLPVGVTGADPQLRASCTIFAGTIAHILATKLQQSDLLAVARRTQPMSVASELLWQLLPPQTVGTEALALAAVLEPAYNVGGDAFDYAVNTTDAYFAIFDSTGHDLSAGLTTSVALAAARTARREGLDLGAVAARIDTTLTAQFADYRFVTGVLARLDLGSGRLSYLAAGHPAPVLVRSGRAVRTLDGARRLPFGRVASFRPQSTEPADEFLEPGDLLLLHSDGVTEAIDENGAEFGIERLVELTERAAADQLPAPETLRRLTQAVRAHRGGTLRDDATLVLVEWSGSAAARLVPSPAQRDTGGHADDTG
jgi:phosphoserine phosphatase RsbU/P